ncbi:glycerophosphodiester phosphodiesterase [Aciditerrimonas ferrireducens]|uniref:Glycerophosphodiester phosphodiesterase n=1 Tax=Aciditerrimonas ferrireducens TaxID=667306 RepID=A0ABV6C6G4_9ACTN
MPKTQRAASPWLARRVLAYAHQGGAHEAPSSTLAAVEHALAVGATGIELDVHASADGVLVVCHDRTVDRTTNGRGRIAEMTWAELAALDNAYWFVPGEEHPRDRPADAYPLRGRAPADPTLRIARLEEVLDLLDEHPGVVLNLDIKATAPEVAPYEAALAETLRRRGYEERTIVASFWDVATERFRALAPEIATSAGTVQVASFWRAVHRGEPVGPLPYQALQVPARHGSLTVVDELLVHAAHEAHLAVHVWTVNDPLTMGSLVDLGVDGIITDRPSALVGILAAKGCAYDPTAPGARGDQRVAPPDPA